MLEQLINSKARIAVLALFFSDENAERYASDVAKATKLDPANVHKELANLTRGGYLQAVKRDGRTFYGLDKAGAYYDGLKSLFRGYAKERADDWWFVLEEIPIVSPSAVYTFVTDAANVDFLKGSLGLRHLCRTMWIFENGAAQLCFIRGEFRAMAQEVFDKLMADPQWGLKLNELVKRRADEYAEASREVYRTNLRALTDRQLLDLYRRYHERQRASHVTGWPSNAVDFEDSLFSKKLLGVLKEHKEKLGLKFQVGEVFSVLTTPAAESYAQKEYRALVEILAAIRRNPKAVELFRRQDEKIIGDVLKEKHIDLYRLIDRHRLAYGWLSYMFEGPGWGNDYFISILASLVRSGAQPAALLKEVDRKRAELLALKKHYVEAFRLDAHERELFRVAEGFVYMKGYRKDQFFLGMYCLEFLFREIARRANLSLKQVRYLYPWEFEDVILRKRADPDDLNARFRHHLIYGFGDERRLLVGEAARKYLARLDFQKREVGEVSQLDGDTASPGKVRGTVVVINVPADLEKMRPGDVLVSIATSPDLMPAIRKAAAIVTDMGGVTCHAAIISRELGVPCVIGTKIATRALHDGDVVDVDASHGRVTVIEKASL